MPQRVPVISWCTWWHQCMAGHCIEDLCYPLPVAKRSSHLHTWHLSAPHCVYDTIVMLHCLIWPCRACCTPRRAWLRSWTARTCSPLRSAPGCTSCWTLRRGQTRHCESGDVPVAYIGVTRQAATLSLPCQHLTSSETACPAFKPPCMWNRMCDRTCCG